jgi:hypothetical protein
MNDLVQAPKTFSLAPASFDDAIRIAEYLSKSDLVPKDYQGKPSNIVVAMAWGAEVGLQALQALQNIAVVNGRGSIWGDAALALCMSRSEFEDIHEEIQGEGDARVAVCTVKRRGRTPVTRKFSVDDAKKAKLWQTLAQVERRGQNGGTYMKDNDSPWYRFPERMLQMRARGFALRDSFPDAMRGLYLAEELQGEEKDVTAQGETLRPSVVMPEAKKPAKQEPEKAATVVDNATGDVIDTSTGEVLPKEEKPAASTEQKAMDGNEAVATAGQLKVIRSKLGTAGLTEDQLADAFGVFMIDNLPAGKVNDALAWIKKGGAA